MDWLMGHLESVMAIVVFGVGLGWQTKRNTADIRELKRVSAAKSEVVQVETHLHEHIDRLEEKVLEQERVNKEHTSKLFQEIKEMRIEMQSQIRDMRNEMQRQIESGFNKLDGRMWGLLKQAPNIQGEKDEKS